MFAKHVYLCSETRLFHRHHILLKTDTWSTAIHGWGRLSMDKAFHSSDKFRDDTDNSVHEWVHTSMDGPSFLGIHFGIHSSTSCTHHHQSSGGSWIIITALRFELMQLVSEASSFLEAYRVEVMPMPRNAHGTTSPRNSLVLTSWSWLGSLITLILKITGSPSIQDWYRMEMAPWFGWI